MRTFLLVLLVSFGPTALWLTVFDSDEPPCTAAACVSDAPAGPYADPGWRP